MWCVTYSDPDETDRMVIMPDYPKVGRNHIIDEYEIKKIPIGKIAQAIKDYDKAYHVDVGKGETVRVNKCPNCESVIYAGRPITHGSLVSCDECNQEYEFQPRLVPLN